MAIWLSGGVSVASARTMGSAWRLILERSNKMGSNAYLIAIGKYSEKIKGHLAYNENFYECKDGTEVIVPISGASTQESSLNLAEACGCKLWDFETHKLDTEKMDPLAISMAVDFEYEYERVLALINAGFQFYFLPNG